MTQPQSTNDISNVSSGWLHLAIRAGNVGLWAWNLRTNEVQYSPEWKHQIGYEVHEISNDLSEWQNRIHPDDLEQILKSTQAFLEKPWPNYKVELRIQHKDGSYRWVLGQAALKLDVNGMPDHMLGSQIDITERKQLEHGLKLAQFSVDQAHDAVFRLNHKAQFIYVNDAACKHLEYSKDELLSMSLFDVNPDFTPEDWAAHVENQTSTSSTRLETHHQKKDGTLVPVEVVANCIELEGEKIFTSIVRNIADRKHAEMALLRHKAAIDTTHDGFWISDDQGVLLEANQAYAEMSGYSLDELPGMHISQFEAKEQSLDEVRAHMDKVVAQGWDVFETRHRHKDGHEIELEASVSYIPNSGQFMAFFRDITERKEAEALQRDLLRQLEAKELAKTRFLAAAGHDLRQPLTAANLYIDTLKLADPTPQQEKIIRRLDHSMSTFNALLDTLLNISKLDAGVIRPEYTLINISEIIIWLEQNFAPIAEQKQLRLKAFFPMNEKLYVHSDFGLLKSVLINLVSNAIKFTSTGAILISVRRSGTDALFQVWDTGMGISAENINHIFDEFYQINNPQRDREGGLGLGLPIARRTLALLDAELTCRSRVGRGSVFGFRLPLQDTSGESTQPLASTQNLLQRESFARNKRFVVVEDDKLVSQGMATWLERMGAEVRCFHSAEEAFRHTGIEHADCYIVDYMLEGMLNGIQFLNQLARKSGKRINAVIVTGDTSNDFIRDSKKFGWPVLHKPIDTSELIDRLITQEV
jgi:PAS domain S-box-containing protein